MLGRKPLYHRWMIDAGWDDPDSASDDPRVAVFKGELYQWMCEHVPELAEFGFDGLAVTCSGRARAWFHCESQREWQLATRTPVLYSTLEALLLRCELHTNRLNFDTLIIVERPSYHEMAQHMSEAYG